MTNNPLFLPNVYVTGEGMSNKLEAALGGIYEFEDSEGDVYRTESGAWFGQETVKLSVNGDMDRVIEFFKADADKIIKLIQEAAK